MTNGQSVREVAGLAVSYQPSAFSQKNQRCAKVDSWLRRLGFRPSEIFLFSGGALFIAFRPTPWLQIVWRPGVRRWQWGEMVRISPRGWDKSPTAWGDIRFTAVRPLKAFVL